MVDSDYPLVSVLIPCYNHERFVKAAIQSVFDQTYPNIELIVIDDGSTDGSWDVIKKIQSVNKFKAHTRQNKGLIETLKELRALASGAYISILASDDFFLPNKLSTLVPLMLANPMVSMSLGRTIIVNEEGCKIGNVKNEYSGCGDLFLNLIKGTTYVSSVSTLIRTDAYRRVDFIHPYIEDLPSWLQISCFGEVATTNLYVASYRHVSGSLSSNLLKMISAEKQIIGEYIFAAGLKEIPFRWHCRWMKALEKELGTGFVYCKENFTVAFFISLDFYKMLFYKYKRWHS